ncbi:MAG: hypothetical protein U9N42_11245 [Campylobacterota bacterium]|nr:hypothetical protein [Campylobacterota bacterium]
MNKLISFLLLVTATSYPLIAAYNPFFDENTEQKKPLHVVKKERVIETKEVFQTIYFGFIETELKKLALIEFNKKHIVVKEGDKVFTKKNELTISEINSNYLILKDKSGRVQQIYFSGKKDNSWRNNIYNRVNGVNGVNQ